LNLKGNLAGHRKSDLRARCIPTPNVDTTADSLCPLAHAGKTPMPIATGGQSYWINAATIIANENTQAFPRILDFDFDPFRLRVAESIHDRFAADTVNFIADQRMQRSWFPSTITRKSTCSCIPTSF